MKRSRNVRTRRNKQRKIYAFFFGSFLLIIALIFFGLKTLYTSYFKPDSNTKAPTTPASTLDVDGNNDTSPIKGKEPKEKKEIIISAAGDCTLGTDTKFGYDSSLPAIWAKNNKDFSYFLSNVNPIFEKDDYTIVNLETPFTDSNEKANKGDGVVFNFKGPTDFVKILSSSNVEGVTIANNHIYDYGKQGFKDTIATLKDEKIDFCGEGYSILKDINGISVGFLGYQGWSDSSNLKEQIKKDIASLRSKGAIIVIPYFHWGLENNYKPYSVQTNLAHFSIDNGADIVLGSHPHVIQSLENYKNKLIVYSLGNFSFGGNFNPSDKRTFITQVKFKLEDNVLKNYDIRVIPTSISSVDYINDYKPTPMEGPKKSSFLKYLNDLSPTLNNKISDEFFSLD